jgi:thioredoxin 1
MNKNSRIGIVIALVVMVGVVLAIKQTNRQSITGGKGACCPQLFDLATLSIPNNIQSNPAPASSPATPASAPSEVKPLPRLVDLGAGKCIPCKMMAPILEELKKEYAGRMNVEFIDVWVNPDAGKHYGIEVIPTQIFYDTTGRELFRHIGFFAKKDILAKWKELGVELK